jgi:isopenicillin N synthase-like dioxygenase
MSVEFHAQVPVIDLDHYRNPEKKEKFVQTLGNAFHEHGFVAVVNSRINPAILEKAHLAARKFFSQEIESKQAIRSSTNNGERGYVTNETPKRQPIQVVDFKEILHIGREPSNDYAENLWPEDPGLKEAMMPLYGELEKAMEPIAAAASEYLGEKPSLFPDMMQNGDHLLRALHYLRDPEQKRNWAAEHTDMNFLTLIPGGASEGLQVQLKDKTWVDVTVPNDALIINVGDSLEHLTNGFYRSGVHQVVSKPNAEPERWSIVFHGHTRHSLEMGPLPRAIELTGGVKRFPDAKGWELLYAQIAAVGRASNEMLQQLAKSGVMDRMIDYGVASEKVMRILAEHGFASEKILSELKN